MKMIQKFTALAVLLAISVSASAETYIRPELLYSTAKMGGDSTSKMGYGVAGGTTLGAQAEHDLSLSISLTTFTEKDTYDETIPFMNQVIHAEAEIKIKPMPVLLNYRYFFLTKTSAVRPYVGASLGFTQVKLSIDGYSTNSVAPGQVWRSSESKSDTPITYGATAGLAWTINDRFALDLGYRYTTAKVEVKDWDMNENLKVSTVALGARFRF